MSHTTQIAARRYTLAEVDKMRYCVSEIHWHEEEHTGPSLKPYFEDTVRTYMMAGVDPAELEAKLEQVKAARAEIARERVIYMRNRISELVAQGMSEKEARRAVYPSGATRLNKQV